MKQISNKEYEKYQQYLTDQLHGRTLTPDGLRIICASFPISLIITLYFVMGSVIPAISTS